MIRFFATSAFVLVFSVIAFAQEPSPTETPVDWYASKAGVIAMTIFLTSLAKRAFGNVATLNAIPTWIYAVVISAALTALAVFVFGTLSGEIGPLISEVVLSAASASGVYEWMNNGSKPLASSAMSAGVRVPVANRPGNAA